MAGQLKDRENAQHFVPFGLNNSDPAHERTGELLLTERWANVAEVAAILSQQLGDPTLRGHIMYTGSSVHA